MDAQGLETIAIFGDTLLRLFSDLGSRSQEGTGEGVT